MAELDSISAEDLVEEIRSTGNHGRDPWLAALDDASGSLIAAVRQLEIAVGYFIPPWLESEMSETDLWDLLRSNWHPLAKAYATIAAQRSATSDELLARVTGFVQSFSELDGANRREYGEACVSAVLAVMVLRQRLEAAARSGPETTSVAMSSNNIAESLLQACFGKLGCIPFGISPGDDLALAAKKVIAGLPSARAKMER
ncbi:MAG TPA: hypothetical protein VHB99_16690 [Pirellulales bacterium]|nr:hypothetical protein [Pirellulales bacterium]